jgi:aryl-alcohol dehydrogenase-like predicted oxidoreductase
MIYRKIAGTDMTSSAICLGTAEFGSSIDKCRAYEMLDAYLDGGGNMIDTAHVYANWVPGEKSISEKTIGQWMKNRGNRSRLLLATKGAHPDLSSMGVPRMSKAEILKDLDESLHYLKTDYIDLYWLHRDDPNVPAGEVLDILNGEKEKGKIRFYGCSNWSTKRIREAGEYAAARGFLPFSASQLLYSLADLNPEAMADPSIARMDAEAWNFYHRAGMTVMAFTSQARGFFVKVRNGDMSALKEWEKASYFNPVNLGRQMRAVELASELAVSVDAVVLSYLISQPFVTIPIIGPQNTNQLLASLGAGDLVMSREQVRYLETGKASLH